MIRDEARADIEFNLGRRSDLPVEINAALAKAQQELENNQRELPWFLKTNAPLVTSQTTQKVALPEGFLGLDELEGLYYEQAQQELFETQYHQLHKDDGERLKRLYSAQKGTPEAYSQEVDGFTIYPFPADEVYNLRCYYYKADAKLDQNIENQWLKYVPELLIGIAGQKICRALKVGADRLQYFQQQEQIGRSLLQGGNIQLEVNEREYQIGGAD